MRLLTNADRDARLGVTLFWVIAAAVLAVFIFRALVISSESAPDGGPCSGMESEQAAACYENLYENRESRER